jgi:hypothetical protein
MTTSINFNQTWQVIFTTSKRIPKGAQLLFKYPWEKSPTAPKGGIAKRPRK